MYTPTLLLLLSILFVEICPLDNYVKVVEHALVRLVIQGQVDQKLQRLFRFGKPIKQHSCSLFELFVKVTTNYRCVYVNSLFHLFFCHYKYSQKVLSVN